MPWTPRTFTFIGGGRLDLDKIVEYVEKWQILVWDRAYYFLLMMNNGYSRTTTFKDQDGTANAAKRLVYR